MVRSSPRFVVVFTAVVAAAAALAGVSLADSKPVGALPSGPTSTIQADKGELIAVALPHRTKGRVWRVARNIDVRVLRQVSEADVGNSVVLVFEATGAGSATVSFGLTQGETAKAYESRRFSIKVR